MGGRLRSVALNEGIVEVGGAFISDFCSTTLELIRDQGLEPSLYARRQTAFVLSDGRPVACWPANELVSSPLLSKEQKLRMLGLLLPLLRHWGALDIANLGSGAQALTIPAEALVRQWSGREAEEYFFAPLLQGLLYWRLRETSAHVLLAILRAFLRSKAAYRLRNGMGELPKRMAAGGDLELGWNIVGLERTTNPGT